MINRPVFLLVIVPALTGYLIAQEMPLDRIAPEGMAYRLYPAIQIIKKDGLKSAADEIQNQLRADSSLLRDIAIITGGNYHLERLTENVFADRVGGFSPSGEKLAYARDTSLLHLDDGLFDWYEGRTTGVFYYDFARRREIVPDIPYANAFAPRFFSDSALLFLVADSLTEGGNTVYKYDVELGQTSECFSIRGSNYYPLGTSIVVYDGGDGEFKVMSLDGKTEQELFDNTSFFSFKRPLSSIQNMSVCAQEIYFQSGFYFGKSGVNIYSLPTAGGRPVIRTSDMQEYSSSGRFCPAAIANDEFLYLANDGKDINIYYQYKEAVYQLTFDGGDKYYLAISPDRTKVAYSYMPPGEGIESYEVFMLNFGRDATLDDIKYRLKLSNYNHD